MTDTRIGFACAYTPMPLIHAAGLPPYRVFPKGDAPDQAGQLLHDNLCPHVKRILDRAMSKDLPDMDKMVFINSCDAMRRLADAWQAARPDDKVMVIDLPSTKSSGAVEFLATEYKRFSDWLCKLSGTAYTKDDLTDSINRYNTLAGLMEQLRQRVCSGTLHNGSIRIQKLYNLASTGPVDRAIEVAKEMCSEKEADDRTDTAPVFLFGNVLPDVEAFELFESSGARICEDDLCTGSRMIRMVDTRGMDPFTALAEHAYDKPACARTFDTLVPGHIASTLVEKAINSRAKGVIGYTLKFCDPYLARLPMIRDALKQAGLPLLLLEGDCTLRSIGQQQTRIEAFVEMIKDR